MRYVHDPAVDVAELLESKEARAMGGVIEDETLLRVLISRCCIDREGGSTVVAYMGTARAFVAGSGSCLQSICQP